MFTRKSSKWTGNLLLEIVNVGKIFSGNSKCLFFFTINRNRKKTINLLIGIVNVGEFYSRSSKCWEHLQQEVLGTIKG